MYSRLRLAWATEEVQEKLRELNFGKSPRNSKGLSSWCEGPNYKEHGQNQNLFNEASLNIDEEENRKIDKR